MKTVLSFWRLDFHFYSGSVNGGCFRAKWIERLKLQRNLRLMAMLSIPRPRQPGRVKWEVRVVLQALSVLPVRSHRNQTFRCSQTALIIKPLLGKKYIKMETSHNYLWIYGYLSSTWISANNSRSTDATAIYNPVYPRTNTTTLLGPTT